MGVRTWSPTVMCSIATAPRVVSTIVPEIKQSTSSGFFMSRGRLGTVRMNCRQVLNA